MTDASRGVTAMVQVMRRRIDENQTVIVVSQGGQSWVDMQRLSGFWLDFPAALVIREIPNPELGRTPGSVCLLLTLHWRSPRAQ